MEKEKTENSVKKPFKVLKKLLLFLMASLLLTVILQFPYKSVIAEPYNFFLINLVPKSILRMKKIVQYSVKEENIMLIARNDAVNGFQLFKINGFLLHVNIVTLFALFIATFRITWLKKSVYLLISSFILFLTHLCHLILNCIIVTPYWAFSRDSFFNSEEKIRQVFELVANVQIFFEQVGRMLFPLLLWCFFCLKGILGESDINFFPKD